MKHFPRILLLLFVLMGVLAIVAGCRSGNRGAGGGQRDGGRQTPISPLDGLTTSRAALERRPIAVLVENSPRARPQTGLDRASIVYEAVTEGGITRFLAIYLTSDSEVIGPVRSARPHFIHLAQEYGAALVHCGESYEALQILATNPAIYNLDQMKYPKSFWRDRSRRAPHNLYTSTEKLRKFMRDNDWEYPSTSLPRFTSTGKLRDGQSATDVSLRFPGPTRYTLRLVYDAQHGGYLRYMDGVLHVDRITGKPLVAKNVIIQRVEAEAFEQSRKGTWDVRVVGEGGGYFLSNGQAEMITWSKRGDTDPTRYTDTRGRALPFQPGQTWIEVLQIDGDVKIAAPK